jgi:hypothetical protein
MASESHKQCVKDKYDKNVHLCVFVEGDLVLVYDQDHNMLNIAKFEPLWPDPYIISHVL